jgi:hypothetical protein
MRAEPPVPFFLHSPPPERILPCSQYAPLLAVRALLCYTQTHNFEFGWLSPPVLGIFWFVGFGNIVRIGLYNALFPHCPHFIRRIGIGSIGKRPFGIRTFGIRLRGLQGNLRGLPFAFSSLCWHGKQAAAATPACAVPSTQIADDHDRLIRASESGRIGSCRLSAAGTP